MDSVLYIGLSIGLTEADIKHMYYWKMQRLIKQWKLHHNMLIKQMVWKIDKE